MIIFKSSVRESTEDIVFGVQSLEFYFFINSSEIGLKLEGEILDVAMKQIRCEYAMKSMAESNVLWCYKLNQVMTNLHLYCVFVE